MRQPRAPSPDRRRAILRRSEGPFDDSDGTIDNELEFDTGKYFVPLSQMD